MEEVQRKAFCKQAPVLLGDHRRHFPPTARTLEKELRRKLEIRLRPSPSLKLNYSKLISLVLCLLRSGDSPLIGGPVNLPVKIGRGAGPVFYCNVEKSEL